MSIDSLIPVFPVFSVRNILFRFLIAATVAFGAASTANALAIEEATIADIHAAYREGRMTVQQVVEAHLNRIDAYDKRGPLINSLITINPKAIEEAKEMDAKLAASKGKIPGPLFGIPVIVKDNLDAVGMPMTSGFQGWKNYYPTKDAPVVAKIKAAGGIIIAKASLSEFARGGGDNINSVLGGFARNPYNTAFATGGSSGGTGASLASSFAVVGIGTDTGGSVRMPSAHNALAGLRPTVGLVSRTGVVPLDSNRDTAGPMARSVADMTTLLDVIVGPDPEDAATARSAGHIAKSYSSVLRKDGLKGARLGVLRQVFNDKVADPRIIARFDRTIAELKAAGAEIIDPLVVPELDTIPRPPQTNARFKDDLTKWIAKHPGVPYPSVKEIADSRLVHPLHQQGMESAANAKPMAEDAEYLEGAKNEQLFREAFMKAMDAAKVDALVFPTWAQLPAVNGDRNTQITDDPKPGRGSAPTHLGSSLTFVGSMLQWPAMSVPSGYLGEGLPVGLQILARAWDESKIVQYGFAYEQATHYRRPPPSVPPLVSTQVDALSNRLIGTWKLIGIRDRDAATGTETPAARAGDSGQLVYAPNGRLSVQIVRVGRDKVPAGSADGFSSYFGTWELLPEEGCVVHHQDGNINVAQIGQAAKRYYSFNAAGHLSLATPPRAGDNGKMTSSVFVWEKMD
jgi:Asp-tRNA(Asn)/Glu-tRNA(Gln) amidotransferase A subunit family amidase